MKNYRFLAFACSLLCTNFALAAGSVSGTLNVSVEIGTGCSISGTGSAGGLFQLGNLNFGTHYLFNFSYYDATTSAGVGGGSISVDCTSGTPYSITINQGQHQAAASNGNRAMKHSSTNDFISYDIYQSATRAGADEWIAGTAYAFTASASTNVHHVYGRMHQPTAAAVSGVYQDTLNVVVEW